jgi:hypothetical protein
VVEERAHLDHTSPTCLHVHSLSSCITAQCLRIVSCFRDCHENVTELEYVRDHVLQACNSRRKQKTASPSSKMSLLLKPKARGQRLMRQPAATPTARTTSGARERQTKTGKKNRSAARESILLAWARLAHRLLCLCHRSKDASESLLQLVETCFPSCFQWQNHKSVCWAPHAEFARKCMRSRSRSRNFYFRHRQINQKDRRVARTPKASL